jgi:hypothetical protein
MDNQARVGCGRSEGTRRFCRAVCRAIRTLSAACVAIGAVFLGEPPAAASSNVPAWHQATATTFGWGMFEPTVSADGRFVAFRSAFDFVGTNPDVNFEIFLYDRESGLIAQVTQTGNFFGNFEPKITPSGDAIVFRSLFNFVGTNSDGSFELFEYSLPTGTFKQLTFTPGTATVSSARMSADGDCVVFLSNFDGTNDVMRYRRSTGELTAVTSFPPGCIVSNPAVNGDGTVVAFRSNHNIDGANPDLSFDIWRWIEGEGISPVTQTNKLCELPAIDGSGRFVAFLSRANLTGENPGSNREMFIADTLRGGFTQVTPSLNVGKHLEPVFSPTGEYLLFESERDPVGLNGDKNRELFRYTLADRRSESGGAGGGTTGFIEQLTQTTGGVSINGLSEQAAANYVAISADSGHIAYRNEHALDPNAEDPAPQVNLEIFVAAFPVPVEGDLNGDGVVNESDLAICLGAWGTADPVADLSGDGVVDLVDISILLGFWGGA